MEVGLIAVVLGVLWWICRAVRWRFSLASHERVRQHGCFLVMQICLWRHTALTSHGDGLGGQSFPTPVETRNLVLSVAGLPVWTRSESIGLPCGSEARFADIRAADFDAHFTTAFSARAPRPAMVRAVRTA